MKDDDVINVTEHKPIAVRQPDGSRLKSSSKGEIPITQSLPKRAQIAHGFPNIKTNLLSIGQFCDSGCEAFFDNKSCTIKYEGNEILRGTRNHRNGLWYIPLLNYEGVNEISTSEGVKENIITSDGYCNNLHRLNKVKDVLDYLYAALFSPKKSTLLQAIQNNNFATFPGLTKKNVKKYLHETIATAMGHLDRHRKNSRTTMPRKNLLQQLETEEYYTEEPEDEDITPKREDKTEEIFASYLAADSEGLIYTDLTGKFPMTSMQGNKYVLLLYHYDTNSIMVRPLKNRSDETTLKVYEELYNELTNKGFQPKLHVLDNEASQALKNQIKKQAPHIN